MIEDHQYKFDSEEEDSIPLDIASLETQSNPSNLQKTKSKQINQSSHPNSNNKPNYYYININHPELSSNASKRRETNEINTSKYTWYSIIPKILIEQFSKMANVYFLIIAILQSIKEISYSGGIPVILLPLTFVICINGIKDIFEDFKRKKSDSEENNRECEVYDSSQYTFVKKKWKDILLGEIVKIYQNDPFPADILLINSAEEHGICYIQTQNLDGETSLKYRHSNPELRKYYYSPSEFNRVNKIIQTSFPNEQIYEFEGKIFDMSIDSLNKKASILHENIFDTIDKNSMLLRGCYLKQTEYIIGVTVYLGHNTKSMKNAPNPRTKTSKIEDIMNFQIVVIFLFQLSLSFIASICNCLMYKSNILFLKKFIYLDEVDYHSFAVIFTRAGTWLLIFTNLVPISLLVTMEMIKFIQGIFISWDIDLYDPKRNLCAKVQTSTLNEELGQVKFIFTDKTGTLTKNHMTFRKMMIGKELYGESDLYQNSIEQKMKEYNEETMQQQGYNDQYGAISNTDFVDYDRKLQRHCDNNEDVYRFLECICLCHSVIIDMKLYQEKRVLLYQASSPDEMSLVSFARQVGFIFKGRSIDNIVTLEIHGKVVQYEILCVFEYTSERKRMSVIARCPDGKIRLYIKGADTIVSKLITGSHKDLLKHNEEALVSFAKEGLRTLMLAYKEIEPTSFSHFNQAYRKIISDAKNKESQMALLYNSIEIQLMLLGGTAIEDQLQDNVDETLEFFASSGIKIWMLTGDKMDTAKSVAFSCKLITHEYSLIEIPEKASLKTLTEIIKGTIKLHHINPNINPNGILKDKYAILISSDELNMIFNKENLQLRNDFYYLALKSQCVICSRVTPNQKSELVSVIKEYQKGTVLAIGDGANDVKMITKADVGIGIMGLEGTQASRASDYSISSFSHLKKLMFVHGRESYRKNSFVICYNFYKNALFVMPQFWMGIINFFSGQTLFDKWIYQLFNPIFTCLPIIWYGIYDTELSQHDLLNNSIHYIQGMSSKLFHSFRFWKWIGNGILQGLLIFIFSFMSLGTLGSDGRMQDMWSIGTMAYSFIVLIASFTVVIYTNSHTWISSIVIAASILSYYIAVMIMSLFTCFSNFNNSLMVFLDLRFYYVTVCLCVLLVLLSIGMSKIMIYYNIVQEDSKMMMKNYDARSNYSNLSNHSKENIQIEEEEIKDIVEKNKCNNCIDLL